MNESEGQQEEEESVRRLEDGRRILGETKGLGPGSCWDAGGSGRGMRRWEGRYLDWVLG